MLFSGCVLSMRVYNSVLFVVQGSCPTARVAFPGHGPGREQRHKGKKSHSHVPPSCVSVLWGSRDSAYNDVAYLFPLPTTVLAYIEPLKWDTSLIRQSGLESFHCIKYRGTTTTTMTAPWHYPRLEEWEWDR